MKDSAQLPHPAFNEAPVPQPVDALTSVSSPSTGHRHDDIPSITTANAGVPIGGSHRRDSMSTGVPSGVHVVPTGAADVPLSVPTAAVSVGPSGVPIGGRRVRRDNGSRDGLRKKREVTMTTRTQLKSDKSVSVGCILS